MKGRVGFWLWLMLALLSAPSLAVAQPIPGSREDFRDRLEEALRCYERVDYRCVIDALEVPLMVRDGLPEGLSEAEVRAAYETLGVVYHASGLLPDSEAVFERLLEMQPGYRLERRDVPPELINRVAVMQARVGAERGGAGAAVRLLRQARRKALWMAVVRAVASPSEEARGREVAAWLRERAEDAAARIANPPWGPWRGPVVSVSAIYRMLVGDDREAWADALGVEAFVGASYEPLSLGFGVRWTRHASVLQDLVVEPAPELDILAFVASASLRYRYDVLSVRGGLELGVALLETTGLRTTLNPHIALPLRLGADILPEVEASLGLTTAWTLGVQSSGELAASTSFVLSLGLTLTPSWW